MKVLIPNVGRRGYLVKYLKSISDKDIQVYVSDCDATASGLYGNNDGYFILPKPVDNPRKYVDALIELCGRIGITVIVPVIDPEIAILAEYKEEFEHHNIFVSVSSKRVLDICYSKQQMNEFLSEHGFLVPLTYDKIANFEQALKDKRIDFPVIVKPIYGSGSVATYKVTSIEELESLFQAGAIIQQYIEGEEYGIDVFNDIKGKPIRCVIKKKISMRSGETDKSITIHDEKLQSLMLNLAEQLGHICNLDCDVIRHGNDMYIIDLNPRFGGGYPATHEAGVNLLELVLKLAKEEQVEPQFGNYEENLLVMKEVAIVTHKMCE